MRCWTSTCSTAPKAWRWYAGEPNATNADADELADWLGDLPPAIEQASAYPEATGLTVPEYLELLREHTAKTIGRGKVADREETSPTHRLVQQSLRARRVPYPRLVQELLFVNLPRAVLRRPEDRPRWRALLPHVLTVRDDVRADASRITGCTALLLHGAATYLWTHGRPVRARPLLDRVAEVRAEDTPS